MLDFMRCFDEHGSGFKPFNHHMKPSVDFATFHMTLYPNPTLGTTVAVFSQTSCILCKLQLLSENMHLFGELKAISC